MDPNHQRMLQQQHHQARQYRLRQQLAARQARNGQQNAVQNLPQGYFTQPAAAQPYNNGYAITTSPIPGYNAYANPPTMYPPGYTTISPYTPTLTPQLPPGIPYQTQNGGYNTPYIPSYPHPPPLPSEPTAEQIRAVFEARNAARHATQQQREHNIALREEDAQRAARRKAQEAEAQRAAQRKAQEEAEAQQEARLAAEQRTAQEAHLAQQRAAREAHLTRAAELHHNPEVFLHSYNEYMRYHPPRAGAAYNAYYMGLLANRRVRDEESELGLAIKYARGKYWECFEWPRDVGYCAGMQRKKEAESKEGEEEGEVR